MPPDIPLSETLLHAEELLHSEPARALELARRVEASPDPEEALQASILVTIGLAQTGRLTDAVRRALMLMERTEGVRRQRLLNVLGACYDLLERPEEAVRTYRRALDLTADPDTERKLRVNLGVALARLDDHRAALREFQKARALVKRPSQRARLLMDAALSHIALDELEAAEAALEAARASAEEAGQVATLAFVTHNEARLQLKRGERDEALARLRELERVADLPMPLRAATLGLLAEQEPDDERAIDCALRTLELELDTDEFAVPAGAELVRRLERVGRPAQALEAMKDLHTRTEARWELRHRRSLDLLRVENEVEELRRRGRALAEANAQLRAMNRDKDELMAIIGHDLRSPLLAVTLIAAQLEEAHLSVEERAVLAEALSGTAGRMEGLIDQLLSAHALDGSLDLVVESYDLVPVARAALASVRANARRKGIALVFDGPASLVHEGNAEAIEQVLANLADNAVKFSPWEGEVTLRLREGPVVEVLDQGPGLTRDDLELAFGKFQRLSARPTGDEPSTGLGLYIVRSLVERLGGRVRARLGPGGCFVVDLSGK